MSHKPIKLITEAVIKSRVSTCVGHFNVADIAVSPPSYYCYRRTTDAHHQQAGDPPGRKRMSPAELKDNDIVIITGRRDVAEYPYFLTPVAINLLSTRELELLEKVVWSPLYPYSNLELLSRLE